MSVQPNQSAPARPFDLAQPIFSGVLASIVGSASSFAIVLQGFLAVGATQEQAASGLFALSLSMGIVGIVLGAVTKMPLAIAWSTPGAALLIATGSVTGGFSAAVGAFILAALLVVIAGFSRTFSRAVAAIPMPLASAMLAGILFNLCLAPVRAVGEMPMLALPIVLVWALLLRFARVWAVPAAVGVAAVMIGISTNLPSDLLASPWPSPVFVTPTLNLDAVIGIAIPLFVVTMASQNIPGLAVLRSNGFEPDVRPVFVSTGIVSALGALIGGQLINLAAITAALCAGPDAHPDRSKRYVAAIAGGFAYLLFALGAGAAAAFISAAPPILIEAVAGLALIGALATSLTGAVADEELRLPAVLTFVTAASGLTLFGIGAAFWGLIVGGAVYLLLRKQ
ncbi:benzoate/H(+) symporter BenE family transporter [Pelagibacterium sp. 26DY04]|uniref:benzoate/H(+) symporter BenE family transporter n=1 Tax=Pelagibacterium sp. 26DY04 TaxID=2967130 RepID=UPI0028164E60|nr:benzoate/H(+) symporter BenE family transporter [Pelagibacterium sp. 26DY04]WMT86278.1 benzoate/H(+) symporter BenE family transporter [Pelagibacterium sp. 26DY04]